MSPTDSLLFSVTLFLALVALLEWKRRRLAVQQKMRRGLRDYAAHTVDPLEHQDEESDALMMVE